MTLMDNAVKLETVQEFHIEKFSIKWDLFGAIVQNIVVQ